MTAERAALRESARQFTEREIVPHLQEWEDAGEIPRELHRTAGALGLLSVGFPEEVGGGGDLFDQVAMSEAMFAAGASSGLMAGLFTCGIVLYVWNFVQYGRPNDETLGAAAGGEAVAAK